LRELYVFHYVFSRIPHVLLTFLTYSSRISHVFTYFTRFPHVFLSIHKNISRVVGYQNSHQNWKHSKLTPKLKTLQPLPKLQFPARNYFPAKFYFSPIFPKRDTHMCANYAEYILIIWANFYPLKDLKDFQKYVRWIDPTINISI